MSRCFSRYQIFSRLMNELFFCRLVFLCTRKVSFISFTFCIFFIWFVKTNYKVLRRQSIKMVFYWYFFPCPPVTIGILNLIISFSIFALLLSKVYITLFSYSTRFFLVLLLKHNHQFKNSLLSYKIMSRLLELNFFNFKIKW